MLSSASSRFCCSRLNLACSDGITREQRSNQHLCIDTREHAPIMPTWTELIFTSLTLPDRIVSKSSLRKRVGPRAEYQWEQDSRHCTAGRGG